MGKVTTIQCDACGADLTVSGNSVDWRIALRNEAIPHESGFVTDMMIYPRLKQDFYFCTIGCMKKIVDEL